LPAELLLEVASALEEESTSPLLDEADSALDEDSASLLLDETDSAPEDESTSPLLDETSLSSPDLEPPELDSSLSLWVTLEDMPASSEDSSSIVFEDDEGELSSSAVQSPSAHT
jgi:hypothetical protein